MTSEAKKKSFDLMTKFLNEYWVGKTLDDLPDPAESNEQISGMEAIKVLWPLNDVFRPKIHRLTTLRYRPRFEQEADEAIEKIAFTSEPISSPVWKDLNAGTWRVLLERHNQYLSVCVSNEVHGNPVITLPRGLSDNAKLSLLLLFGMHKMTLPFQLRTRSELEIPDAADPPSLRLH